MKTDRDTLLRTFLAETEELLGELETAARQLPAAAERAPVIEAMFRVAHTLKGNASCLGFDAMTGVAHQLEDQLAAAVAGRQALEPGFERKVLTAVDQLARMAAEAAAGEHRDGDADALALRTIRIEVARLDRALDLVAELAVARGRLADAMARGDRLRIDDYLHAADQQFFDLHAQIMQLRMVPIQAPFERLHRAVRDLALATGKQVRLVLACDAVEVDVAVADALHGPLTHLIRNAVDHGIETSEVRRRRGKPAEGTVTLSAWHDGGYLVVELGDDGAGLDRTRLLERAARMGLEAEGLTDEQVAELAFTPGLSTREQAGELSGRGIGMDVVRRAVENLRGSVTIRSRAGTGAAVTLRVPLALSIVQGLAVGVGGETYVLPLDHVVECVRLDRQAVVQSAQGGVLELRGEALPYVDMSQRLGAGDAAEGDVSVVVVEQDGRRAGLAVGALLGEVQTVIKPMSGLFGDVRGVSGSAILADGRLALVVDVRGVLRDLV